MADDLPGCFVFQLLLLLNSDEIIIEFFGEPVADVHDIAVRISDRSVKIKYQDRLVHMAIILWNEPSGCKGFVTANLFHSSLGCH